MNFTKVLTLSFFLIMIFVANSNAETSVECAEKCAAGCLFDPGCTSRCLDKICHPHPPSRALINCKLACSVKRCSKFKQDKELMRSCWNECSAKHCS
ncbi:protein TAP1-like [Capsicum chacoense]